MSKPAQHADQVSHLVKHDTVGFLVHEVARAFTAAYSSLMKPLGLTRPQARVIAYVTRFPGITQVELCEYVGVGRMAMTGLIDRMESKGLVRRAADPTDRRVKRVFLTRQAQKLRPDMEEFAAVLSKGVVKGISSKEIKVTADVLKRIKENLLEFVEES